MSTAFAYKNPDNYRWVVPTKTAAARAQEKLYQKGKKMAEDNNAQRQRHLTMGGGSYQTNRMDEITDDLGHAHLVLIASQNNHDDVRDVSAEFNPQKFEAELAMIAAAGANVDIAKTDIQQSVANIDTAPAANTNAPIQNDAKPSTPETLAAIVANTNEAPIKGEDGKPQSKTDQAKDTIEIDGEKLTIEASTSEADAVITETSDIAPSTDTPNAEIESVSEDSSVTTDKAELSDSTATAEITELKSIDPINAEATIAEDAPTKTAQADIADIADPAVTSEKPTTVETTEASASTENPSSETASTNLGTEKTITTETVSPQDAPATPQAEDTAGTSSVTDKAEIAELKSAEAPTADTAEKQSSAETTSELKSTEPATAEVTEASATTEKPSTETPSTNSEAEQPVVSEQKSDITPTENTPTPETIEVNSGKDTTVQSDQPQTSEAKAEAIDTVKLAETASNDSADIAPKDVSIQTAEQVAETPKLEVASSPEQKDTVAPLETQKSEPIGQEAKDTAPLTDIKSGDQPAIATETPQVVTIDKATEGQTKATEQIAETMAIKETAIETKATPPSNDTVTFTEAPTTDAITPQKDTIAALDTPSADLTIADTAITSGEPTAASMANTEPSKIVTVDTSAEGVQTTATEQSAGIAITNDKSFETPATPSSSDTPSFSEKTPVDTTPKTTAPDTSSADIKSAEPRTEISSPDAPVANTTLPSGELTVKSSAAAEPSKAVPADRASETPSSPPKVEINTQTNTPPVSSAETPKAIAESAPPPRSDVSGEPIIQKQTTNTVETKPIERLADSSIASNEPVRFETPSVPTAPPQNQPEITRPETLKVEPSNPTPDAPNPSTAETPKVDPQPVREPDRVVINDNPAPLQPLTETPKLAPAQSNTVQEPTVLLVKQPERDFRKDFQEAHGPNCPCCSAKKDMGKVAPDNGGDVHKIYTNDITYSSHPPVPNDPSVKNTPPKAFDENDKGWDMFDFMKEQKAQNPDMPDPCGGCPMKGKCSSCFKTASTEQKQQTAANKKSSSFSREKSTSYTI